MALSPEHEAQILRYYHAERWRIGTIAARLGLHRDTVARVLAQAGLPRHGPVQRASAIDPICPSSTRRSRSFRASRPRGSTTWCAHAVTPGAPITSATSSPATARARAPGLPAATHPARRAGPGRLGHFGHLTIGRARRPLMAFVMVLSWSRQIYLRFFLDARMENFLRGHVGAFECWGAVPRIALYDNLKSAVLERCGNAIRFHPTLLALAGHYRFEPRPVAVARGNEKGRVERAIRYVRGAFFAGCAFADLDDLNAQAQAWCEGVAGARAAPEDASMTVAEAFAAERERLLARPQAPFPTDERARCRRARPVRALRPERLLDPHPCAAPLTVCADPLRVRILDGEDVIATHARSYDRRQQIESAAHLEALVAHKRAASAHRATDRLTAAVPTCQALLAQAAERGEPLGRTTRALTDLLDRYGADELGAAVDEGARARRAASQRGTPGARAPARGAPAAGRAAARASEDARCHRARPPLGRLRPPAGGRP